MGYIPELGLNTHPYAYGMIDIYANSQLIHQESFNVLNAPNIATKTINLGEIGIPHNEEITVIAESFNKYASKIQDKQYCAQVSTFLNQRRFEDEDNNKPIEIKEPDVYYKDIKLKKTGEFGQNIEYSDGKGGKYEKHKFKAGAEVIKIQ